MMMQREYTELVDQSQICPGCSTLVALSPMDTSSICRRGEGSTNLEINICGKHEGKKKKPTTLDELSASAPHLFRLSVP